MNPWFLNDKWKMENDKWKVRGSRLKLSEKHQDAYHNKRARSDSLHPNQRYIVANNTSQQYSQRRNSSERQAGAKENCPGPLRLGCHRHRSQLRLVAHLGEEDDSEGCQQYAKVHYSILISHPR